MSDDKAPSNTVAPPADAAPAALGDAALPKSPSAESDPAGPASESKPQEAPEGDPPSTADAPESGEAQAQDSKEGPPVGTAERKLSTASADHPALAATVEEAEEMGETWAEETGGPAVTVEEPEAEEPDTAEPKPEEPPEDAAKPAEDQLPEANGPAAADADTTDDKPEPEPEPEQEQEPAEDALPGDKRSAAVANGSGSDGPAEKKAKVVSDDTPTANGGAGRPGRKGNKDSKEAAPLGKTARRTRSQGLTEL